MENRPADITSDFLTCVLYFNQFQSNILSFLDGNVTECSTKFIEDCQIKHKLTYVSIPDCIVVGPEHIEQLMALILQLGSITLLQ